MTSLGSLPGTLSQHEETPVSVGKHEDLMMRHD